MQPGIQLNPDCCFYRVFNSQFDCISAVFILKENKSTCRKYFFLTQGTTTGTVTDPDGNYSLSVPADARVLQFSFVGMKTQEITLDGRTSINVVMEEETIGLDEVIAIGYGTVKKSDLTGSVQRVNVEDFQTQSMVQVTDMLAGTVAGFNANQGASAQGGASMEIRGPTSLTADTDPLIVVDGVIFDGALRDINPYDIESVDILKDTSSAAVFGSKAASGVVIITTTKGRTGKPTISVSTKMGLAESYNERRGLGPEEYIQFRQDYFRQMFPNINYNFYTHPDELPGDMSVEEWRSLSAGTPLDDNVKEWMARLRFFPTEQKNYLAGKTMDMYDEVFRTGFRQEYDVSVSGGTDVVKYYWSLGYNNKEGIRVGDQY
ncbi:MAG: TonB-dependent receptor plug domain-containing protein, partial [Prolixibacteraceae bacterium]|nr:TonB-dependent receptor plug domain-containing protein [Prolixibacteraceae bacterium]